MRYHSLRRLADAIANIACWEPGLKNSALALALSRRAVGRATTSLLLSAELCHQQAPLLTADENKGVALEEPARAHRTKGSARPVLVLSRLCSRAEGCVPFGQRGFSRIRVAVFVGTLYWRTRVELTARSERERGHRR